MYLFVNMIGNIIVGVVVDKFGVKKIFYISMGIMSFIVLLYIVV